MNFVNGGIGGEKYTGSDYGGDGGVWRRGWLST